VDEALQTALDFVEGRITGKEFEQKLYSDPAIETLFKDASLHWHDTYIKSNPYDFLIGLDYDSPGGVLNAQGAVEFFLTKRNISFKRTPVYSEFYDLLLSAQPKWVHVDTTYLKDRILPEAGDRKGKPLKEWLKGRLKELFRFNKKPPKWIQSPKWPIGENGPMYFLGQIKIEDCELFHDEAAAYLFLDPISGATKTVIQVF